MSRPIETSQQSTTDEAEQQKPADSVESVVREGDGNEEPIAPLRIVRAQVEIKAIMAALKRTGWNRKQAATLLRISYRGLLYKIRQHKITAA